MDHEGSGHASPRDARVDLSSTPKERASVQLRKRTRSPAAADSLHRKIGDADSSAPTYLSPTSASTEAYKRTTAATASLAAAKWSTLQQRFIAAQWRRGCFYLPMESPLATGSIRAAPVTTPASKRCETPIAESSDAIARWAAQTARYIPSNPWKVLRCANTPSSAAAQQASVQRGALIQQTKLPEYLPPPAMVQLEPWNTYWEAYSACCAEELEGLAKQLAGAPLSTAYRRVLLTLSSFTVSHLPSRMTPVEANPLSGIEEQQLSREPNQSANSASPRLANTDVSSPDLTVPKLTAISSGSSASQPHSCPLPSPLTSDRRDVSEASSSGSYSYSSSYSSTYTSSNTNASSQGSRSSSCRSAESIEEHENQEHFRVSCLPFILDDLLCHYAHRFGAVEYVETRDSTTTAGVLSATTALPRVIVSLQFTTAEAAGLFYRWADGLSVAEVVRTYRRDTEGCTRWSDSASGAAPTKQERASQLEGAGEGHEEKWWEALEQAVREQRLCLVAKVAPHDPRCLSSRLLLGPNVLVSTPLVQSLFAGLFEATHMEYCPALRAFRIDFASMEESRLALHALQSSLWRVFRVPLLSTRRIAS